MDFSIPKSRPTDIMVASRSSQTGAHRFDRFSPGLLSPLCCIAQYVALHRSSKTPRQRSFLCRSVKYIRVKSTRMRESPATLKRSVPKSGTELIDQADDCGQQGVFDGWRWLDTAAEVCLACLSWQGSRSPGASLHVCAEARNRIQASAVVCYNRSNPPSSVYDRFEDGRST